MKELAAIPIIMSLILGFSIELIDIANESSEKVLRYTEAMEKGIDCAFRGELILECSPELASIDFDEDLIRFEKKLEEIKEELKEASGELNMDTEDLLKEYERLNATEFIEDEDLEMIHGRFNQLVEDSA